MESFHCEFASEGFNPGYTAKRGSSGGVLDSNEEGGKGKALCGAEAGGGQAGSLKVEVVGLCSLKLKSCYRVGILLEK